jgi:hypothetical protein
VSFSAPSYTVAQGAGTVALSVARAGTMQSDVSVDYSSSNGTAAANTDYTPVSGTLHWAANDSAAKTISVPIGNASSGKSFQVALSNPSATASMGSPSSATVSISGNTPSPPPTPGSAGNVQLSVASYTVAQGAGALTVTVQRAGGNTGAVSVSYATANGSAVSGTDYTAANGTLNWASGDSAAKTFSIAVSNATPFPGSKSFTVALSNATSGAKISTPGSAGVTINGSGAPSGGGGPPPPTGSGTAPTALLVTGQSANAVSLSWTGVSGAASYKIYRNGGAYATSSSTNYTDSQAFTATVPAFDGPANLYTYAVSAVDSSGKESAATSDMTYWVYHNGVFSWEGDYSYGAGINYSDTSGSPQSGPYDMAVHVSSAGSGIQPYAGKTVPLYDLELGAFNYIQLDIKPTLANQSFWMSMMSRLPPGDVFPHVVAKLADYGPAFTPGKWATYKIPLTALHMGKTSFVGSISGSTLTVASASQSLVDAGGFISGPGVTPGTYIINVTSGTPGGPGTYTVVPAQNVSSTTMTYQRTHVYKFDLMDQLGAASNLYYLDNIRFTTR